MMLSESQGYRPHLVARERYPLHARCDRVRLGATMVAVVVMLPILFGLAAFAINISYVELIRAKTQIVTDISARAAGRAFVETNDQNAAIAVANEMAELNLVQDRVIDFAATDFQFGLSQRNSKNKSYTFTEMSNGNSVRLSTQSFADGAGEALHPFFPVMGSTFEIRPLCFATNTQTTLDVAIVIDRSGSMLFAANEPAVSLPAGWNVGDPAPVGSRWRDLMAAVNVFCDELSVTAKEEKIGLVSYADTVTREVDLTTEYAEIRGACETIAGSFQGGATNVGGGLQDGIVAVTHPQFARPWAENAIVLMSDGNHNTGSDPIVAAQNAAAQNVPVYTVSFSTEANTALMQQIADLTGGSHYLATTPEELSNAFRDIARRLPAMLTE